MSLLKRIWKYIVLLALLGIVVSIVYVLLNFRLETKIETIRWTLSSLLQGLCAIFGLVLVFYIYFRSATENHCRELVNDISRLKGKITEITWNVGDDNLKVGDRVYTRVDREQWAAKIASKYDEARKVRKNERELFRRFRLFSLAFAIVILLDFLFLTLVQHDIQLNLDDISGSLVFLGYWVVAGLTGSMIVALGLYSTVYFHVARRDTQAKRVRDKGIGFFKKDFDQHVVWEKPAEIVWKNEYEKLRKRFKNEKAKDTEKFFGKE